MNTDFLERSAQLAGDFRAIRKELSEVSALVHECVARAREEV